MAEMTLTRSASRLIDRPTDARGVAEGGPESPRWQQRAACQDVPTALFFPAGSSRRLMRADEERAKRVCATCVVRPHCLAFAVDHQEPDGVWGGLNAEERRALDAHEKKET